MHCLFVVAVVGEIIRSGTQPEEAGRDIDDLIQTFPVASCDPVYALHTEVRIDLQNLAFRQRTIHFDLLSSGHIYYDRIYCRAVELHQHRSIHVSTVRDRCL